jgi:hypothetical protein
MTTPEPQKRKTRPWIAFRTGEPCQVFESREEAVKWFQGLLKQTLSDFECQVSEGCGYCYPIEIKHLLIRQVDLREESMGL